MEYFLSMEGGAFIPGQAKDYLKVLGSEEKSIAYATGYCREGRYTRTLH